jgi:long-chain acyl-CoA synthetase
MKKQLKYNSVPEIASVQDMLIKTVERNGSRPALEDLNNTKIPSQTYNQLLSTVLKFGAALRKLGIKERAHVAIISENRAQWGISYLTCMCFNYVVVPIDKNLHINEILNILYESDSEVIIFSDSFEPILREKESVLKKLKYYISMDLTSEKEGFHSMVELIMKSEEPPIGKIPRIKPEEMAEIIFTSGSLGRAKGVMLSQKNIASNLMSMVEMFLITDEDRFLSVLPIHHTYECTCGFLCPLSVGATVYYARSLKTVSDDLQKVKATMFLGVPLLFEKMFKRIYKSVKEDKVKSIIVPPLIKASNFVEIFGWKNFKKIIFKELHEKFGGHIRAFIAGGAAPDPDVAKGLREFGFNFRQGYGLTETSPILALNQYDYFKDNAAGMPLPRVELKINNPDSDGIGELYAKGPNVMIGYYKNEQMTKDAFDDGWFRTGDLGYFDEDGFLHISGRKKNVIIAKNGKNVFPEEIEDILLKSPYILEVVVYGEKDPKQDEIIAAQIVVDAETFIEYSEHKGVKITNELINGIISDEVKKTNDMLTSYKHIKKFYIRDQEFEKTTTQKVKRYLLKTNGNGQNHN